MNSINTIITSHTGRYGGIFRPLWITFSMLLIIVSGCEVPTQSSDKVTPELSGISAYLPLEGTSAIPIITSQTEADANKQAFQKITKGQAMNRITAYLKTKQGPHLITSSRKNAQEENYRYAEKGVTIPDVLARKANGKEITYVYTERTAEGKVMQMAMVRIPDTPEIRTLVAKWFRNGISRRDPSREGRVLKTSMANPLPGVLSDTCQLDPDEVDPRCIDNEQYFDQDLGMYVLCDIIVCDDELVGEGDGGGSPNAPDDECTIACDPGWGEPGGGGSSGLNLPANPANEDIFVVIDPITGETFDLTFLQNWMSWVTPEIQTALLSSLWYLNVAPPEALPNFGGSSRILTTIGAISLSEPTFVSELVLAAVVTTFVSVYIYDAYMFINDHVARLKVKNKNKCVRYFNSCNGYRWQCDQCLRGCLVNLDGCWNCSACPIEGSQNCQWENGEICNELIFY